MKFPKKYKLNTTEPYLIQIEPLAIKNEALKALVQASQTISYESPYALLSFNQWETLMKSIGLESQFEHESLGRLQMVYVKKGKGITKDEAYISEFSVSPQYTNLLESLKVALETDADFKKFSSEEKAQYLLELKNFWQASVTLSPEPSPHSTLDQALPLEAPVRTNTENQDVASEAPQTPPPPSADSLPGEDSEDESEEDDEDYPSLKNHVAPAAQGMSQLEQRGNFDSPPLVAPSPPPVVSFLNPFDFKAGEGEVTKKLNVSIQALNQKFDQANQALQAFQQKGLAQKIKTLEKRAYLEIDQALKASDRRVELKSELLEQAKKTLNQTLSELEGKIQKEKQVQIDQVKKAFEEKLVQIQNQAEETQRSQAKSTKAQFLAQTKLELKQMLESETNQLMHLRLEKLQALDKRKQALRVKEQQDFQILLSHFLPDIVEAGQVELSRQEAKFSKAFEQEQSRKKQDQVLTLLEETKRQHQGEQESLNTLNQELCESKNVIEKLQLELDCIKTLKPQATVITMPEHSSPPLEGVKREREEADQKSASLPMSRLKKIGLGLLLLVGLSGAGYLTGNATVQTIQNMNSHLTPQ